MKMAAWRVLILFLSLFLSRTTPLSFNDITKDVFSTNSGDAGRIVGFGDLNNDRNTDILRASGSLQWDSSGQTFITHIDKTRLLYDSMQLLDINDDGTLDAMATNKTESSSVESHLYYNLDFSNIGGSIQSVGRPLLLDWNGDHIIDFLTRHENENWDVWSWNGTANNVSSSRVKLEVDVSDSAHYLYGDMNGDCLGDIVVMNTLNHKMEVFTSSGNNSYNSKRKLSLEIGSGDITNEYLIDLDVNGLLDLLLVVKYSTGYQLMMSLQPHDGNYPECKPVVDRPKFDSFVNVTSCNLTGIVPFISTGDVNLDGFPDVLFSCNGRVFLLMNSGCGQGCPEGISLQPTAVQELDLLSNVGRSFFFDLRDNGILDILVEHLGGHFTALEYVPPDIHMFLKVYAPSGSCDTTCSSSTLPGSTVMYITHDRNGYQQVSVGHFWSSSVTSFLPLPYIVLGLGLAPNFIEDFVLGTRSRGADPMYRKWTRLIPNSQLKVVTNPVSDPSRWKLVLYLTPSNLVWISYAVMTAVCILVSILVLLLHLREKYIDAKERKQTALQFHFDAM